MIKISNTSPVKMMGDGNRIKISLKLLALLLPYPSLGNDVENVIFIHASIRFKYTSYIYHNLHISCRISPSSEDISPRVSSQRESNPQFPVLRSQFAPSEKFTSHPLWGIRSSSSNVYNKNRVGNWNCAKKSLSLLQNNFKIRDLDKLLWNISSAFVDENPIELQTNTFK